MSKLHVLQKPDYRNEDHPAGRTDYWSAFLIFFAFLVDFLQLSLDCSEPNSHKWTTTKMWVGIFFSKMIFFKILYYYIWCAAVYFKSMGFQRDNFNDKNGNYIWMVSLHWMVSRNYNLINILLLIWFFYLFQKRITENQSNSKFRPSFNKSDYMAGFSAGPPPKGSQQYALYDFGHWAVLLASNGLSHLVALAL